VKLRDGFEKTNVEFWIMNFGLENRVTILNVGF